MIVIINIKCKRDELRHDENGRNIKKPDRKMWSEQRNDEAIEKIGWIIKKVMDKNVKFKKENLIIKYSDTNESKIRK